jgi:hypothetical protein
MTVSTLSLTLVRCRINAVHFCAQLARTLAQATNQADLYYIQQFKVMVVFMQYEFKLKEQGKDLYACGPIKSARNMIKLRSPLVAFE